jgi:CHAT domain
MHLRAHPEARHKTRRVFNAVQSALATAVDARLVNLLRCSETGVKIIGDAPLEWLPVDGLPLCLRFDVSRINATPGGLTFGELTNQSPIYLEAESFRDALIISAFDADDPIREHVRTAVEFFSDKGDLRPRIVEVHSTDEFVQALNSYRGPLLVFDGHGAHEEDPDVGILCIGSDRLDVWTLRARVRVPPIVVLSACDTHASDRSHATTANGFISCGARSVLGTCLPVNSANSARLVGRLLYRAVAYCSAATRAGIAVPWTRVISGLMRMQFTSDVALDLMSRGRVSAENARGLMLEANTLINRPEPDWFERFSANVRATVSFSDDEWQKFINEAIAGSDVIRYMHVGSPETVIISSRALFDSAHDDNS